MSGSIRDSRERLLQSAWYEALGLVLMAPICSALALLEPQQSVVLLACLSAAVMGWSAVFNTVFDRLELAWVGISASERPHRLRLVHALLFESTAVIATCPVIVAFTGWSFGEALAADLGLSLLYAAYGYVFHWGYDRLRPVRATCRAR